MRKTMLTLTIFFAMVGAAHADPIFTPIFTAIFGIAGFTGSTLITISAIASARATRLIIGRRRK